MSAPFFTYLTLFQSRLAVLNIVLDLTGFGHQPETSVVRKIKKITEERVPVALGDDSSTPVFSYLAKKKLVGKSAKKKGRYKGLTLEFSGSEWSAKNAAGEDLRELPVYSVDVMLSAPQARSTIGVPTPENANEAFALAVGLGVISRSKCSWTLAGQTAVVMRKLSSTSLDGPDNPFLLGAETVVMLRQLLRRDGIIIRELLREISTVGPRFTRDEVALRFPHVVKRAVASTKTMRLSGVDRRIVKRFADLVTKTAKKRSTQSSAPGVLEHRVTPRLEWLTDLGYLSKDQEAKNAFEYNRGDALDRLLDALDAVPDPSVAADRVALAEFGESRLWAGFRASVGFDSQYEAILHAYRLLKRSIGAVPVGEAALVAALLGPERPDFASSKRAIGKFAQETEGVSLSRGRYRRSDESIHIAPSLLDKA